VDQRGNSYETVEVLHVGFVYFVACPIPNQSRAATQAIYFEESELLLGFTIIFLISKNNYISVQILKFCNNSKHYFPAKSSNETN